MADISQISISSTTYDIKDTTARNNVITGVTKSENTTDVTFSLNKSDAEAVDINIPFASRDGYGLMTQTQHSYVMHSVSGITVTHNDNSATIKYTTPTNTGGTTATINLVGQNAGLMSPSDKANLDYAMDNILAGTNVYNEPDYVIIDPHGPLREDGSYESYEGFISGATQEKAGVMTAADKTKLEAAASATQYIEGKKEVMELIESDALLSLDVGEHDANKIQITATRSDGQTLTVDIDPAHEGAAGLMTAADKTFLDGIYAGNKSLVKPTLAVAWTIKSEDGVGKYTGNTIASGTTVNVGPFEIGAKVSYTAAYKYDSKEGCKNPSGVDKNCSFGSISLPNPSENSGTYSPSVDWGSGGSHTWTSHSVNVKLKAAKTGLMVNGGDVVPASGDDFTEAKVTFNFYSKVYYGTSPSKELSSVSGLTNSKLINNLDVKLTGVTASNDEYFVFAYPSNLLELGYITLNNSVAALGAFDVYTLQNHTNEYGVEFSLRCYVSKNPNAFTNDTLQFTKKA